MKTLRIILLILICISVSNLFATTWDEPWKDRVVKEADYFVYAKIKSCNEQKGITIQIIKTLGGPELKGTIRITDFYLLDLCSTSGGHGPEFHTGTIKEAYFFIKKDKEKYCIATPSTGYDYVENENVYAIYRHSYHTALVPVEIYEKTVTAIFNSY